MPAVDAPKLFSNLSNKRIPAWAPSRLQPGVFLTAEWRWLAVLNYEIEPGLLQQRIPKGTELDEWNGRTFVSVVGFRFLETQLFGVAVPFHRDFDEVNLRFYVRRRSAEGWRRGAVFVREFVPRTALAALARLVYGEPYTAVPMRHTVEPERGHVSYAWRYRGKRCAIETRFAGEARLAEEGSLEAFLVEHYWGYTSRRGGSSSEYGGRAPALEGVGRRVGLAAVRRGIRLRPRLRRLALSTPP